MQEHSLESAHKLASNENPFDPLPAVRAAIADASAAITRYPDHRAAALREALADRLGLKTTDGNGPIGIGVAVVRGSEMYVATVGPAEAYLIRQARLSTLPDPHRERGLPSSGLEPDVWRGEITMGDVQLKRYGVSPAGATGRIGLRSPVGRWKRERLPSCDSV